jgi:isoleucyl-tRNA synthetase
LHDFPVSDADRIDHALSHDMDAVLEVVGAGHAARQDAGVKVRQPLPSLFVHTHEPALYDAVTRLQDQILDELNVKSIAPLRDPERFVSYTIRPNLRRLGPRLGKRLNAVRDGLAALDPAEVASIVAAGRGVPVPTPDGPVMLEPEDILVGHERLAGYATAQGLRLIVVLDTSLTPELIAEGLVRDFVRGVQDGRKQAGYQVEDSIAVAFVADPEVVSAVRAHKDYVMAETLAVSLEANEVRGMSDAVEPEAVEGPGGAHVDGAFVDQIEVGEHAVRIALRLVAGSRR